MQGRLLAGPKPRYMPGMEHPALASAHSNPPPPGAATALALALLDEKATVALAGRLAACLPQGAVVALTGPLGAGKTSFARGFIAARARACGLAPPEVPSPTFTLLQTYDFPTGSVWHFDLYRITDPQEVWELGWEDGLARATLLIEWPERLGALLPADRVEVALHADAEGRHSATIRGLGSHAAGLAPALALTPDSAETPALEP